MIGHTTDTVCEGELLQIENRHNLDLDEATYFDIIARKTAALCATCCLLGAELAGATPDVAGQLERYGRSLGIAFQIQDDILDLVGDTQIVGKTLGIDAAKGKMTLPMIHFLQTAPAEHRALLRSLLTGGVPDQVDKIRNLILPSESIPYARNRARALVDDARSAIVDLPASDAERVLDTMAEFVISRPM